MIRDRLVKRLPLLFIVGSIGVCAIFLIRLASWLWGREHYQFFPLVLIAASILAWFRYDGVKWTEKYGLSFRVMSLTVAALFLLLLATGLQSNLLGALSALICAWAGIWYFGGKDAADRFRGPLFFLVMALPIPLNYDLILIIKLQKIASTGASRLLDFFSIRHDISGVAISTAARSFMVEEACSGVHSLFSCLCAVVFLSVLQRYSFVRILVNIVQTVVWVIAANTLRVFLVIYAFSAFGIALDSGWRHELLGVFTYVIALSMALSTDRLLMFLVPFGTQESGKKDTKYEVADNPVVQLMSFGQSAGKAVNRFLDRERLPSRVALRALLVVPLICLTLSAVTYGKIAGRLMATSVSDTTPQANFVAGVGTRLRQDGVMPKNVDAWTLENVEHLNRQAGDTLGENSVVFTYTGHGLRAVFSLDGFYSDWHDLAYCYSGLDWKLSEQSNFTEDITGNRATYLSMYMADGSQLTTYFSCIDSQLTSVKPSDRSIGEIKTFENLLERLSMASSAKTDRDVVVGPVLQFQLTCFGRDELLPHEKDALRQLFGVLMRDASVSLKEKQQ